MIAPVRDRLPIYLAALGPRNLVLAGEKADGWLAMFFSPEHAQDQLRLVADGRRRAGADLRGFDVAATVATVVGEDVAACADALRAFCALYLGGMGNRKRNFYREVAARLGFGDEAERVQELYLSGDRAAAAASVPIEFIDLTCLIGPPDRISRRMRDYAQAGVTTLNIKPFGRTLAERRSVLAGAADAWRNSVANPAAEIREGQIG
jgi:alkanesulfonate monooxygenase SsuD/methylene tetrahydromethanopterin reductase-like flavin-dependent oxidoreductase (luciferase family)